MTASSDLPQQEMAPVREESIVGSYFAKLTTLLESEEDQKQTALMFAQRLGSKYFIAILQTLPEIDRVEREMRAVLKEFTGRSSFLGRLLTIEHLAAAMKLYVISWATLLDSLARLVSLVFNLGIADRDIRVRLVLENSHVKSSRVPEIWQQYEKTLLIKGLRGKRNDAVHRGRIPDEDVEQILRERNRIDSHRYSLLETNPISEEEYKRQISLLQEKLGALAKEKQELWEKHHQQTIAMVSAVAGELALKTIALYKSRAI